MKFLNGEVPDIIIRLSDISNVHIDQNVTDSATGGQVSVIDIILNSGYKTKLTFNGKTKITRLYDSYVKIMELLKKKKQASMFLCIYCSYKKSYTYDYYVNHYDVQLLTEDVLNKALKKDGGDEKTKS